MGSGMTPNVVLLHSLIDSLLGRVHLASVMVEEVWRRWIPRPGLRCHGYGNEWDFQESEQPHHFKFDQSC